MSGAGKVFSDGSEENEKHPLPKHDMPLKDIDDMAREWCRARAALTEKHLVGMIEELEGRVPTNDEVRRYGRKTLHPNGDAVFTWKHDPILVECADGTIKSRWKPPT